MRKIAFFLLLVGLIMSGYAKSTFQDIPPAPDPPRLVNDFAGVLSDVQVADFERRLVDFNDSTSNVICIVTVEDLGRYSAAQYAYEIGDKWGVKSKDKNNGVVILIKPRNSSDGEVYISVGYDLEAVIPDALAKRIIEQKMIPELAEGNYAAALDSALAYILPLAAGEISVANFEDNSLDLFSIIIFSLIIIISIVVVCKAASRDKDNPNNHGNTGNYGGGTYYGGPYFGPMGDRGFGGYSGGGSFGGGGFGGGGFGGFGGMGGFGGGGAGGRF